MKLRNLLLSTLLILFITGCVGSTPADDDVTQNEILKDQITKDAKEKSLDKIKSYVKNHVINPEPTSFDYNNVNISGVTKSNIGGINNRIKGLNAKVVTVDNIQTEVNNIAQIVDTKKPTIILNGNASITLMVGDVYTDAGSTAIDNKDGDITVSIKSTGEIDTSKAGTYTIIYNVSDSSNNVADGVIRTVTVKDKTPTDTISPSITLNGASSLSFIVGESYTDAGATANDNKDGNIKVTTSGTVDTNKAGTYTLAYTATDAAGNTTTTKRIVTVKEKTPTDTIAPSIKLNGASSLSLIVGESYTEAGATANDKKDGNVKVTTSGTVDTNKAGTYTLTYTAIDAAGNTATTKRTVIVIEAPDTQKPTISLKGDATVNLTVGDTYTEQGATANDNKDGDITANITPTGTVDTTTAGTYIITYNVADKAGNTAVGVTRKVIVKNIPDTTKPTLTLNGESNITLTVGDTYTEQGATASDETDGNITALVVSTGIVDTTTAGTYIITYNISDVAGNTATEVTRTVTVDGLPVITLKGANPLNLDTVTLFTDPGASAEDAEDGDISSSITNISTVRNQIAGQYEVTYTVTDSFGHSVSKTRDVILSNKLNALPLIEIAGANPFALDIGKDYVEPGVSGRDTEDGDITSSIKTTSTIDNTKAGSYEVKYQLTDSGGLTVNAIRVVVIAADSSPVITLKGDATQNLNLGEPYTERGAVAIDKEDGDISNAILINTSSLNTNTAGTYQVKYSVTDTDSNTGEIIRTVVVKNDSTGTLVGVANNVSSKHIGSGVGGAMFAIAFHPTDANNIFFSGDMGLVYHTINGGQSWDIIPGLYKVRFMQFDPKNPSIVWAGGGRGLHKSTDGGKSWNYSLTLGSYKPTLGAMAIDPSDSNILYIAEGFTSSVKIDWVRGKVWKSTNGGASWNELSRPGGSFASDSIKTRNYTTIVIDPNSPVEAGKGHSRVYLTGRDGIFSSNDSGTSWNNISFFDAGQGGDMVLVNNNGASVLFTSVIPAQGHNKQGVYRSDDNGATWSNSSSGLDAIINRLAPRNKNIKNNAIHTLMLAHSPSNTKRLYVGSWQGAARSDDMGLTWVQNTPAESGYERHSGGSHQEVPTLKRSSQSNTFLGGIDNFIRLSASLQDSNLVALADNQDLHISKDAGKTWKSELFDYTERFVDSDLVLPALPANSPKNRYTHRIKSRGVQGTVNTDIAIDPFESNIYYATYMDIGLQISRDGGESWEHPSNGLPPRGHVWSVLVDSGVEGRLWVGVREKGALYTSSDKGVTWSDVSIGDSEAGKVAEMAIDLSSPLGNRTLYAATENKGIYKSIDNGQTWSNVHPKGALDVKIDLDNPSIVYSGGNDGVYKSIDNGENWTKLAGDKIGHVYNVSVGKDHAVYLTANEPGKQGYWDLRKLWKSYDGGATFTEVTPGFMKYIGAIAVNPNDANYIYAANFNIEQNEPQQKMIMARSKDGGLTWEEIGKDFAFAMAEDLYINPKNTKQVLFNTRFSLIETNDTQAP